MIIRIDKILPDGTTLNFEFVTRTKETHSWLVDNFPLEIQVADVIHKKLDEHLKTNNNELAR
jgi:adenylate kinase family enzyme